MNRHENKHATKNDALEEKRRLIEKNRASVNEVEKALNKIVEAHKPAIKELAKR